MGGGGGAMPLPWPVDGEGGGVYKECVCGRGGRCLYVGQCGR